MSSLRTSYDFTLPRGYVDGKGQLHKTGTMRLATARDELEPLRDPTVSGPDDPRLTILVITRVLEKLGTLELITSYDVEGLFAVDLAFLQDFYGVINFGNQEEYDALVSAQAASSLLGTGPTVPTVPTSVDVSTEVGEDLGEGSDADAPSFRRSVEELPRRAK